MAGAKRDYYEVLGVPRDAPKEEIKRSYRRLAKEYHPDMAKGMGKKEAEERFKELSEAYEVLSDDEKRALYDRYGYAGVEQRVWGGQGFDWSRFTRYRDVEDIFGQDFFDQFIRGFGFGGGSIFDEFFGRQGRGTGGRSRGASRGRDLQMDLDISLRDVTHGGRREVEIPAGVACEDCGGTGAEGGRLKSCPSCGGSGQVSTVQRRGFGQLVTITTCDRCGGRGRWAEERCKACKGRGTTSKTTKVALEIPRGAPDGLHLRLSGKGEPGGAGPGDLFVVLHIRDQPPFRREGRDLVVEVFIPYPVAVLGREIEVPTLDGSARLKVPPGTQPGTVLRMKGKGLPDMEGASGDQLVRIAISVPATLSPEERKLLEQLMALQGGPVPRGRVFRRFS
jgi:molecular chaperone DnaJ